MSEKKIQKKCLVITAPSGAGKTTIVKHLLRTFPERLGFSVSATTRIRRENETDGKDYYFLTPNDFRQKIAEGAFVEYEEVYPGQFYGTLHSELERLWGMNRAILFDIDVKGAINVKRNLGEQCLAVFVEPPDIETLIQRLKNRNTETDETLRVRIQKVREELSFKNRFDRILVNDILSVALKESEDIVESFLDIEKEIRNANDNN